MNAQEETMLESVGEVSGSEKESVHDEEYYELNAGSDNGSVNDEVNQNNPLIILLHQATQSNDPVANLLSQSTQIPGQRISERLPGGTQVEVALHSSDFSRENESLTSGKRKRKRRPTPDYDNLRHGKRLISAPS